MLWSTVLASLFLCLWHSWNSAVATITPYIPQHNRFSTLDITTANVPLDRRWTSTSVLSLAGGSSSVGGGSSQKTGSAASQHVLLFGGYAAKTFGDTWLYNVDGNSWWQWPAIKSNTENHPSPVQRYGHTCTSGGVGSDMQVAALFGGRNLQSYNDVWIFPAAELNWQYVNVSGVLPAGRWLHTNVFIGFDSSSTSYQYLVFGGKTDWNGTHVTSSVFNLNDLWLLQVTGEATHFTAEWTEIESNASTPLRPAPRGSHVAVWAESRQAMIIVGGVGLQGYLDIWECTFVKQTARWTRLTPDFPGQRYLHAGYSEQTAGYWDTASCVVLFGGKSIAQDEALWTYCIDSGAAGIWQLIDTSPSLFIPPSMADLSSVVIGLRMYLFGGQHANEEVSLQRPWSLYVDERVTEGVWFNLAPPVVKPLARRSQTAVAAGNSTMVVYGGATTDISWPMFALLPNDVWVLNVTNERWTRYALENVTVGEDVPRGRAAHVAVVRGSSMWIFGGVTKESYDVVLLDDVWRWSLVSHTWTQFGQDSSLLPTARRSHAAVTTNLAMLVFGGISNVTGDALDDLWEFSYHNATWSPIEQQNAWPTPRFGHTAVAVENNMLVFGGVNLGQRTPDPSVWMFDSTHQSWSQLSLHVPASLDVPYFHSASSYGKKMIISGGCSINEDIWNRRIASLDMMSCQPQYRLKFSTSVWVFDTAIREWDRLVLQESLDSRIMHTTAVLGSVFAVYGGYSLDTLHAPVPELAAMHPGCNIGQHSKSYSHIPCRPCSQGTYSGHPGASSCASCPGQTTTPANINATSILNCTRCKAPACHDNGVCSVSLPDGDAVCRCRFGYIGSDMCQNPVYYYLIFFAIFGTVVLVSAIIVVARVKRMMRLQRIRAKKLRTSRCELARLTEAWYIEESELTIKERVDMDSPGSFGTVMLAEYREMPVAVKHLHSHISNARNAQEFETEVRFMRTLRHPNIVLFLGGGRFSKHSAIGPGGVSFIVMEFMSRGTLSALLRNGEVHIDRCQALRFALDAAKGMRFLHGRTPPCIHRDLKSSNLLVSERWVVKVADFGEACPLFSLYKKGLERSKNSRGTRQSHSTSQGTSMPSYTSSNVNGGLDVSVEIQSSMADDERTALLREGSCDLPSDVGTLMWQAPEMLRRLPYGPSADVYSFGIVLWEIASRKQPYEELPSLTSIMTFVLEGNRPSIPEDCPVGFAELMRNCWRNEASQRPTFRDIVEELDHQLESWSPQ